MKKKNRMKIQIHTDVSVQIHTRDGAHYAHMPRSVRIGPYHFPVELMSANDATGNREFGHCNIVGQRIRIAPDMGPQKLANTFIHECLHGMHWVYGLGDSSDEEDFTHLTANALCCFWMDNPAAAAWFAQCLASVPQ